MRSSVYSPISPAISMRPQGILGGMNLDSPQAEGLRWWMPGNDGWNLTGIGFLPKRHYGGFPFGDPTTREAITGSPTWVTDSKCAGFGNVLNFPVGGARLDFDTESGNLQPQIFEGTTNTISITAWIQTDNIANYRGIVCDSNGGNISLLSSGAGGNPLGYLWTNDGSDYNAASGLSFDTTNGNWQLVGIVITPTAGILYMADDAGGLRSFTNTTTHTAKAFTTSYGFQVADDRGNGRFWQGRIVDVRLYQRSLTANDFWQIYDPASRWDLYRPMPKRSMLFYGIASAAVPTYFQGLYPDFSRQDVKKVIPY